MKPVICLLTFITLIPFTPQAQTISQQLNEKYDQYKEGTITQRRFKHAALVPLLGKPETG